MAFPQGREWAGVFVEVTKEAQAASHGTFKLYEGTLEPERPPRHGFHLQESIAWVTLQMHYPFNVALAHCGRVGMGRSLRYLLQGINAPKVGQFSVPRPSLSRKEEEVFLASHIDSPDPIQYRLGLAGDWRTFLRRFLEHPMSQGGKGDDLYEVKDSLAPFFRGALHNNQADVLDALLRFAQPEPLELSLSDGWEFRDNRSPWFNSMVLGPRVAGFPTSVQYLTGLVPLVLAARDNSVATANVLIKNGIPLDMEDPQEHINALFMAVRSGSVDVLKLLLAAGCDIAAARDSQCGRTALHLASVSPNSGMLKFLLRLPDDTSSSSSFSRRKIDIKSWINQKDRGGMTPAEYSVDVPNGVLELLHDEAARLGVPLTCRINRGTRRLEEYEKAKALKVSGK